MPIDAKVALAADPTVREISWTTRDVLLYHLGLGAGADPVDPVQLRWTYEGNLHVLPTFAVVAGQGVSAGDGGSVESAFNGPGLDIDLRKVLHGGQELHVHKPIPTHGRAVLTTRIADIWDKGKAAVIVIEHDARDETGEQLWTARMQIFVRGEGGFGGDPGPSSPTTEPAGKPDHVLRSVIDPRQALIYRLSGDLNPLHADPVFAQAAGFDRPILHGLATYGTVARAVVEELLDGDPNRLRAYGVRFAGTIVPGETIETSVWRDGDRLTLTATCPERDGAPVLSQAWMDVSWP